MDAYQYKFDDREKIVEELQNYLTECQYEVTNILEEVGWTPEHFIRVKTYIIDILVKKIWSSIKYMF
jgi:hypothetical protein